MHHVLRTWQSRDDRAHHSQYAPRPSPVLTRCWGPRADAGSTGESALGGRRSTVSLAGLLFW